MRILYVTTLARGGPLTHLRALAPALARRGFDVAVLCAGEDVAASFRASGVAATVAPLRHKLDLAGAARLCAHVRGVDIVHTHDRRAGLYGRLIGVARGARVVHTLHGLPEDLAVRGGRPARIVPAPTWRRRAALRVTLELEARLARLGRVVTPSSAMRACLVELGIPAARIDVVPHWIDVRQRAPRARGSRVVLGVVAQLEPWKGIDVLIAACERLATTVRIEIFGAGSARTTLERRAMAAGVDARFHGHVDDVRTRLRDVDIFVLPSRAENSPFSILEAMANALPVVATRVGGIAELVDHERTGLLVAPDDPAALAAALDRLVADASMSAALGCAGARRAADEFSESRLAPRVEALYRRIVAAPCALPAAEP